MSSDENYFKSNKWLLNDFPWLPSTKKVYKDIGKTNPIEFVKNLYELNGPELTSRIETIFVEAINNSEIIPDYEPDELNIQIYWMLRILLYILNNTQLTNRVANLYSKNALERLKAIPNKENLYWICEDLGLNIKSYFHNPQKITSRDYSNISLHYLDFIKLAEYLKDENRKLVNNSLSDGYVILTDPDLERLIQEYVRNEILNFEKARSEDTDKEDRAHLEKILLQVEDFKKTYKKIKALVLEKKEDLSIVSSEMISFKEGENLSPFFPPCVRVIYSKIERNENLVHNERLFLVFFLNALKYPLDEMINIFKMLPDFDESIARYQVEFAVRKAYTPHGCAKLETLGMCYKNDKTFGDEICRDGYYSKKQEKQLKISHPLSFVNIKKYRELRNKTFKNTKPQNLSK